MVGLSVFGAFIGAAIVTLPVFVIAVLQFGWSLDLGWVMLAYAIIQFLDGNVLVPLLFSEAVDLHPITIIVAVLAFGGLWGLWGVFFAIPLATLIKAIYVAWPQRPTVTANLPRLFEQISRMRWTKSVFINVAVLLCAVVLDRLRSAHICYTFPARDKQQM